MTRLIIEGKGALRIAVRAFENYAPVVVGLECIREDKEERHAMFRTGAYIIVVDAKPEQAEIVSKMLAAQYAGWDNFTIRPEEPE